MDFWGIEQDWIAEDLSEIDLSDFKAAELFLAMSEKPGKRRDFYHAECGHLGSRGEGLRYHERVVGFPIRAAA